MEVQVDVWLGVIRWLISRANRPMALKRFGFSEGGIAIIVHPVEVTPESRLPRPSLLQSHSSINQSPQMLLRHPLIEYPRASNISLWVSMVE